MSLRILLLSAYDALSHQLWRGRLQEMFPEHAWTQLALPPRHFNWRIRGNSLQWALNERDTLSAEYDLVIATSMVDLASLRGFLPELGRVPTVLYFHENQFAYPKGMEQRAINIEPQLVPLYSAVCADAILFNSDYNRSTFLEGAEDLLAKLPDRMPAELMDKLRDSAVIPVPLTEFAPVSAPAAEKATLDVVWNHRWEYDKGPSLLLALAEQLLIERLPIRLHVVGQKFRSSPAEFQTIDDRLRCHADAIEIERGSFGFVEQRADYLALLSRCDVVLSTALHDFQGLALQEAVCLGCTPLAPRDLVYPEYLDEQFLYDRGEGDEQSRFTAILERLTCWQAMLNRGEPLPRVSLEQFSMESLRPRYASLFEKLTTGQ